MHTVSIIKTFYEEYFGNKEDEEEVKDTVMVCKEVPKSDFDMDTVKEESQKDTEPPTNKGEKHRQKNLINNKDFTIIP